MQRRWWNWKSFCWIGAAFLTLHGLSLALIHPYNPQWSYLFMWTAPWMAFAASCLQMRAGSGRPRTIWILISAALFLWAAAMSLAAMEDLDRHAAQDVALLSDLIYFLYGVPVLLAISSPAESKQGSLSLSLWLDGIQAAITSCLVYLMLFGALPFTHGHMHGIPATSLMWTFNIENLSLAIGATLRLLFHRRAGKRHRSYQILAGFLWIYCICAGLYNYEVMRLNEQMGFYDLLPDLPFVLFFVAVFLPDKNSPDEDVEMEESPAALFIDNVSPVLYTFALLALGAVNVRTHFKMGMGAILVALAVYALRTTLLQNRYMRSQRALKQAHDRLEAIALEDALTGVANRRRFDQALRAEWNRAFRLGQPLSLLMIDIDYFKSLNDRYGHLEGDRCLMEVAKALSSVLVRSGDLLARYGGEEFAAILVNTRRDGAEAIAAHMQEAVHALRIRNETAAGAFVTISIGVKSWETEQDSIGESPESLIEASDRALYRAKENGRNRVEFASSELLAE